MPTARVRLKPIEWFQEIGHYPQQGGEDRYLRATCTYSDDPKVRLSTGAQLSAFLADLTIMDEDPQYADGRPLDVDKVVRPPERGRPRPAMGNARVALTPVPVFPEISR